MHTLIRDSGQVRLAKTSLPEVVTTTDVLIRVELAGLCRTDVWIADGDIPLSQPRILGHEFSGTVVKTGSNTRCHSGDRVAVFPFLPCGVCPTCIGGASARCPRKHMLGWHHDGAFAQYITVPDTYVYSIPDTLSWERAAYAEPVAASLATHAVVPPKSRGWIWGNNRIAELTRRCLAMHGHAFDSGIPTIEQRADLQDQLDVVIETECPREGYGALLDLLRPGGRLVVKSRRRILDGLPSAEVVMREVEIVGAAYAPFTEALDILGHKDFYVEDLFGATWTMDRALDFIGSGGRGEARKAFLAPNRWTEPTQAGSV